MQVDKCKQPITLVGMMGSGKSTVGRRLANALGRVFIDADRELEARLNVPIPTIFELEGEEGFRRRETLLLDELSARCDIVVATGGGVVLAECNRRMLQERTYVVYLKASLPELWHRLRHDKGRPLLRAANPRERIAELVQARDPMYEAVANLEVLTSRQPVERLVADIMERIPQALRSGV
jgi:shikimate kinase